MSQNSNWSISDKGRADLSDIWNCIALDNEAAATRTVADIYHRFETLAKIPKAGRRREDLRKGLRHLPIGNVLIFYLLADPSGIHIVRVLERHRDTARILGDEQ